MFLSRRGSLHALEQTRPSLFWRSWLDPGLRRAQSSRAPGLPSADSIGRICFRMDLAGVRALGHHIYSRLKRMKALEPLGHGLILAIVEAHETTASRRRCCSECCRRTIHTQAGNVTESGRAGITAMQSCVW